MTPDWEMFWDIINYVLTVVCLLVLWAAVEGATADYRKRFPDSDGLAFWILGMAAVAYLWLR
jgi:hypothetical protein